MTAKTDDEPVGFAKCAMMIAFAYGFAGLAVWVVIRRP